MLIHGDIKDWEIKITEIGMPDTELEPRTIFNWHTFKTIAELREYFEGKYSVAISLGYNLPKPADPKTYNLRLVGRLSLTYSDRFADNKTFEFASVAAFVKLLNETPELAKCVGYTPK
jgi:hypothetical protein